MRPGRFRHPDFISIVASADLYGGTWTLFSQSLKQFGIETRFVDPADPENFRVANIGGARLLAIYPATAGHQQLSHAEQLAAGVTPGYVRLSIGIEHPDDIIADLSQALDTAGRATAPAKAA